MSRCRHPRLPMPSRPARPGLCPVRAAPASSEGPVRRGADRKEARQEGELPLRVYARVCVPGVCVRVCACACACLCAPAALAVAALALAPARAASPFRRRRLPGPSRAGPGFINMLIVLLVGGESRVKVTRASAPRATTCVRRAARGRERSRERLACDAALKKRDGGRDPGEGGRWGAGGDEASRSASVLRVRGVGSGAERERGLGEAEPGWAVRCSPLSTLGRDGALTPACVLRRDLASVCGPCVRRSTAAGWEKKLCPNSQSNP